MTRGLVIGKFMPLHAGHIALIQFAADQCDELTVSMTFTTHDPIPGEIRFEWIRETFREQKKIKPEISPDNFDREDAPLSERIPLWAAFLKNRFQPFDIVFSSEEYGAVLAEALHARHISFDPGRVQVPVSAMLIREKPTKYWDFIAAPARYWFVKKICFYGPESTGKSTLAEKLARKYDAEFVPEVAREIVASNDFTADDIVRIGQAQTQRFLEKIKITKRFLFCDTDVITTEIYCRHYLKVVPSILYDLEKKVIYDQYFLFDIDVPWVADGMRDLKEQRNEMLEVFRRELETRNIPYQWVRGSYAEREAFLTHWIEELLR